MARRDGMVPRTVSDAFIAGLTPARTVLRDSQATHDGILASAWAVGSVTDSLRTGITCLPQQSDRPRH